MVPENWNKDNYKKFVEYLISIKDEKYKEFHNSLVLNSKYEMIGIRLPSMRKIAKEISKTDIEEFCVYMSDSGVELTPHTAEAFIKFNQIADVYAKYGGNHYEKKFNKSPVKLR